MNEPITMDRGFILGTTQLEQLVLASRLFDDLFATRSYCNSSLLICYNETEFNQAMDITPNKPSISVLKNILETQLNATDMDTYLD